MDERAQACLNCAQAAIPCNTAPRIIPVPGKIAQIKNLSASQAVNALPDASPGRPEMITLRRWVAAPSIGLVLFLALMTLAFLYVQDAELEQQKQTHSRNLDLAQKALKLHWQDQIDSLAAAGQAWNAAGTDMPGEPTQSSPAEFLRRNPDLAWVGALDRGGKLLWIEVQRATERPASRQPGGVIAEPASATAARQAARDAAPVWSAPFQQSDGTHFLEVHLPSTTGAETTGTLFAAYPLAGFFDIAIPDRRLEGFQLELTNAAGDVLARSAKRAIRDATVQLALPLDPPGHGLTLRLYAFEAKPKQVERLLYGAVMALSFIILGSLALLWRAVRQRALAEAQRDYLLGQSLAESAFRRAMEDSMLTGMRAFDLKGRITYVNRAFCRMTGFDADELVGKVAPFPYWTDEEEAHQAAALELMLAGRVPTSGIEVRLKRRDGVPIDTRMYVSPLVNKEGEQAGWMTSVTDITEPRRIRAELAAAHERFTTVLDEIDAAVSVLAIDYSGKESLLFANPMYRRLFGMDPAGHRSLQSDHRALAAKSASIASVNVAMNASLATNSARSDGIDPATEVWSTSAQRWFEVRNRPIRWVDGRQVEIQVATDVTARRVALDRQRRQDEKLAHTSRLVTMGEMASSLAHEMNQPLAAISNYVSGLTARVRDRALKGQSLDREELLDALAKTGRQAERAGEVIRRIRAFVRRSEPAREACNALTIVADAVGLAQIDATRHRVQLLIDVPESLPKLWADPILIEQVLLNLMKNAIEAMLASPTESGAPRARTLGVSACRFEHQVEFAVSDTGPGLSRELHDRLFEPFYTTKAEGMGMGLNICRTIIEFHEGRLWIDTASPTGCVFRFTLPIVESFKPTDSSIEALESR